MEISEHDVMVVERGSCSLVLLGWQSWFQIAFGLALISAGMLLPSLTPHGLLVGLGLGFVWGHSLVYRRRLRGVIEFAQRAIEASPSGTANRTSLRSRGWTPGNLP